MTVRTTTYLLVGRFHSQQTRPEEAEVHKPAAVLTAALNARSATMLRFQFHCDGAVS
jgi:hypothetical protein